MAICEHLEKNWSSWSNSATKSPHIVKDMNKQSLIRSKGMTSLIRSHHICKIREGQGGKLHFFNLKIQNLPSKNLVLIIGKSQGLKKNHFSAP